MKQILTILMGVALSLSAYNVNAKNISNSSQGKSQGYFCNFAYSEEEAPECFKSNKSESNAFAYHELASAEETPGYKASTSSNKKSQGYFCNFAYSEEEAPECF